MDVANDLLVEIGTEELPPLALPQLSAAFADGLCRQLREAGIGFAAQESFAAPRRLGLLLQGIATRQPDQESVRRGPAIAAAFGPDGTPSKAAEGFARSCGVAVSELARERSDKGEWLVFRSLTPGQATAQLIPAMVERALADLPIPRRMRWGAGEETFVRPVHWVCLMLGDTVIPGTVLGLPASDLTFGHRFHHPAAIRLAQAGDYANRLRREGFVEPSFAVRRTRIAEQVQSLARERGLQAELEPALLDEVAALVEWPRALVGGFDPEFLAVPPEVLIETMRKNQKYFPLRDNAGRLQPLFVAVSNLESKDPEQVRAGNERVIRPRFTDAKFFWEQDLKQPLSAQFERLESVVFQDKLGSLADKCRRIARLAHALAARFGEDPHRAERASLLAKCDLMSAMVFEFPALQGVIGRYYAIHAGEEPAVSEAMAEQYLPRFAGDTLPSGSCGRILAVADRLDTLVGIFGIGQRPTGAKDPYGLRRASIAVLRILIETPVSLDLKAAIALASEGFPKGILAIDTESSVLAYMLDRLAGYYQDQGIDGDAVDAVLAVGLYDVSDLDRRIRAVQGFRRLPAAYSLAAANKRIRNILAKVQAGQKTSGDPERTLFGEPCESGLWSQIERLRIAVQPLMTTQDYVGVLALLSELKNDVDGFFDQVMVMADDPKIRDNRLALLGRLQDLFLNVADFSRLQIEETGNPRG